MSAEDLGRVTYSFFLDYLPVQKGLRPASIRSYRDTLRLFLQFAASDAQRKVARLTLQDLTFVRVKAFLQYLEEDRKNHIPTRNQRLVALHTFFEYVARKVPEMLPVSEQVAAIPMKRTHSPETTFLERGRSLRFWRNCPPKVAWRCGSVPSSYFCIIPGLACRKWQTSKSKTWSWRTPHASGSTARVISGGRALYGRRRPTCSKLSCSKDR